MFKKKMMNATVFSREVELLLLNIHENVKTNMYNGDTLVTLFMIIFLFLCAVSFKVFWLSNKLQERILLLEQAELSRGRV